MLKEQLEDLNIFALREYARRMGVNSPTSKKKDELIKEILDIKNGVKSPVNSTNKGRPPKEFTFNIMEYQPDFSTNIVLHQEREEFFTDDKGISGYVAIFENIAFIEAKFNNTFKKYLLPLDIVTKYNLKNGDFISANLYIYTDQIIVKEIETINGVDANEYVANSNNFYTMEHDGSLKDLVFDQNKLDAMKLHLGENVYIYGNDNRYNTEMVINMLNYAKVDKSVYINLALVEKTKSILMRLPNTETFVANLVSDSEYMQKIIDLSIERIKRLFELGKNVIVAIDDMASIHAIDKESTLIKTLLSLAKTHKDSSITMISIMPSDDSLNNLNKLADRTFDISVK